MMLLTETSSPATTPAIPSDAASTEDATDLRLHIVQAMSDIYLVRSNEIGVSESLEPSSQAKSASAVTVSEEGEHVIFRTCLRFGDISDTITWRFLFPLTPDNMGDLLLTVHARRAPSAERPARQAKLTSTGKLEFLKRDDTR